jgi:quercetin dioxygenase-like cupin family protein
MIPRLIHWDPQWGRVSAEAMSRLLRADGYVVFEYHYPPGTHFPLHRHAVEKKDSVVRGRLCIAWEGAEALLAAGDMIEIPASVRHSAEVVGSETVVSLDAAKGAE